MRLAQKLNNFVAEKTSMVVFKTILGVIKALLEKEQTCENKSRYWAQECMNLKRR